VGPGGSVYYNYGTALTSSGVAPACRIGESEIAS
jgi:hypothetical protein